MDRLAAEAGVGKQTLYRWWSSRAEVLLEALRERAAALIPVPDTGVLQKDLERFLAATFRAADHLPGGRRLLCGLMTEAQLDPDFRTRCREAFIEVHRASLRAVFARAKERGELRRDFNVELGIDMAFGAMWYRLLVTDGPLDARTARELAAALSRP